MPELALSQHAIVTQIKRNLQDRYQPGYPILKELLQNADDAGARRVRIDALHGWPTADNPLLQGPGLLVVNDGEFRPEDEDGICSFSESVKATDAAAIGKFGLGQKAVFHWCDAFVAHAFGTRRFSVVVNPFLKVNAPHNVTCDWDELSDSDAGRLRDAVFAEFRDRALVLWLPFRSERLRPAPNLQFSTKQPLIRETIAEIARTSDLQTLLTLLRHLESIEIREQEGSESAPVTRCVVRVRDKARRLRGPHRANGGRCSFRGTLDTGTGESARFIGREATTPNKRLNELRASNHWPKTSSIFDTEPRAEKGEPHGAVALLRSAQKDAEPRQLTVSWAVFLPISETEDTVLPIHTARLSGSAGTTNTSGLGRFRLLLHGYFFVDSGRSHVEGIMRPASSVDPPDQKELYRAWNTELRNSVVLPLIPVVLQDAVDSKIATPQEIEHLVAAIGGNDWFANNRRAICRDGALVRVLAAPKRVTWRLVPGGSAAPALRPLPSSVANTPARLQELFPGIHAWAEDRNIVLCVNPDACLTSETLFWTRDDLESLLSMLSPRAFQSDARACLLAELLGTADAEKIGTQEMAQHVLHALRSALIDSAPLAPPNPLRDILSCGILQACLVPLSSPVEHRQVLRVLASASESASTYTLPVRRQWIVEGLSSRQRTRLSQNDLIAFLRGLAPLVNEPGDLSDQAATAALDLLKQAEASLTDLARSDELANISVLHAQDLRSRRTVALSLKTLVGSSGSGLLFEQSPDANRLLPLLDKALTDATPIIVGGRTAATLRALGESSLQLRTASRHSILSLVSRHERFGPDLARAKLLNALPPTVGDDRNALRSLCAGSSKASHSDARLWVLDEAHGKIERAIKEIVRRSENGFLVPSSIAGELTPNLRKYVGSQTLDNAALEKEIERNIDAFPEFEPTMPECEALLQLGLSDSLLKRLPIHERSDGVLVSAECLFRGTDRVPTSMRRIVPVVRLYEAPAARKTQEQLIREWSWKDQIQTALSQPHPAAFCFEVLDALSEQSTLDTKAFRREWLVDALKEKRWLPVLAGAPTAPKNVLRLPASIGEPARELLQREGEGQEPPFFLPDQLPVAIRERPGYSYVEEHLFPDQRASLNALGRIVAAARLPGRLGLAPTYPIADFAALGACGVDLALPGWPLLAAVLSTVEHTDHDCEHLRQFTSQFTQVSSEEPVTAARHLNALTTLAESHDQNKRQAARRAYEHGFDAVATWPENARQVVLRDTKVPTKAGGWRPGREVIDARDGVAPTHLLETAYAAKLHRHAPQPNAADPMTDAGGSFDSSGPSDDVVNEHVAKIEADCVDRHRAFLRRWRGRVPSDLVLVYLGFIGRFTAMRALAREWEGDTSFGDVDTCWEYLDESFKPVLQADAKPNPLHARVEGRRFRIEEATDETVRAVALSGDLFDAPLDKAGNGLLVGNLHKRCTIYKHRRVIEAADGTRKLLIDLPLRSIDPMRLDRDKAIERFRRFVGTVAEDCLLLRWEEQRSALYNILDMACCVEQTTVDDTIRLLRDRLPTILGQMKLPADSSCRAALQEYQIEETQLFRLPGMSSKSKDLEKLKVTLWERIYQTDAAAELLAGVRGRIKDLGYSAERVLFELFQNADDACRQLDGSHPDGSGEECFRVEVRSMAHGGFRIIHWGRRINDLGLDPDEGRRLGRDRDLLNMLVMDFSEKPLDKNLTGKFGLGFKSVHIVSDAVGIASGFIALRTFGGFLPTPWSEGIDEAERYRRHLDDYRATIIDVPFNEHTVQDGQGALQVFRSAMTWLPVFARRIRRIEGSLESVRCEMRSLPTCTEGEIDAVTISTMRVPTDQALRFNLGDGFSLLLRMGSEGPVAFSTDLKRLWNVAPLEEDCASDWLLNGPFLVDPGRGRLAGTIDARRKIFQRIGRRLGDRLLRLHAVAAADWCRFAETLQLGAAQQYAEPRFWKGLFDVFSRDLDDDLAKFLHSERQGYGFLAAERPVVPTGLPEPCSDPVSASMVDRRTDGALNEPDVLQRIRDWPALNDLKDCIVSSHIADRLGKLGFRDISAVTLTDLLRTEMGSENRIEVNLGTKLGRTLTTAAIEEKPLLRERDAILETARQAKFRAQDGTWRPVKELNSDACGDDEMLICGFAPPMTLLHLDYVGASLDFFKLARARSGYGPNVRSLFEWACHANDEDARRAVLRYVLDGRQGRALAEELRKDPPPWLPRTEGLLENPLLAEWSEEDRKRLLLALGGHGHLQPISPPPTDPVPVGTTPQVLKAIHAWWNTVRSSECRTYTNQVYPECFSPSQLRESNDRTGWFTMFALACFQALGRTQDRQHCGFIARGWRDGWWPDLALSRPPNDVQSWLERLVYWSAADTLEQDFLPWKRTFVDLYTVARHLDTYIVIFQSLPSIIDEDGPMSLNDLLHPTYSPAIARLGLDAAPLDRSLGIGTNWMIRELVRHGVYNADDADSLAPYCWAPTRRVRQLLNHLGEVIESPDMDASRFLYEFIRDQIGPDRGRFHGDFDLPLQLVTCKAYRDTLRQFFQRSDSEVPDLDDVDDESSAHFTGDDAE